jgi:predicted dehydrogenase
MSQLRVGVIGLGEVAQIVHLPVLQSLPELFEISAVCDISPTLVQQIGDRYAVSSRYADASEMIEAGGLDAVLVLNSDEYHADCVIAALQHGVHVLVEKPMCLSPREADAIIAARDASDAVVMVGYMRRFAPAFTAAKEQLPSLGQITYARVHDIIGQNRMIIDQTSTVIRPDDLTQAMMEDRRNRARTLVNDALGDVPDVLASTYRLLCGLGSHDLSAMRELLGPPRGVVAARQWRNGNFVVAMLEYDGYYVTYETGVDAQLRFDAHIEVYGESSSLRVQYDTPYVRHLPTTLISDETRGDAYIQSVNRPHLKDPYTHELEYFHEMATTGGTPKSGPEDFVEDLDLFAELIRAIGTAG